MVDLYEWVQNSRGFQAIAYPWVLCRLSPTSFSRPHAELIQPTQMLVTVLKSRIQLLLLSEFFVRLHFSSCHRLSQKRFPLHIPDPDSTEVDRQSHLQLPCIQFLICIFFNHVVVPCNTCLRYCT